MYAKALAIGIIGGADGPTAIFVTSPDWTKTVMAAILLAAGIFGFLWARKRNCKK